MKKQWTGITIVLAIALLVLAVLKMPGAVKSAEAAPDALMGYYNLMGYEGIGTVGITLGVGQAPPVGDWTSTNCRFINVLNTTVGQYYLRYPLHLPNGAKITNVSLFVADFNSSGVLWAYLRSRPWNTRLAGATESFGVTGTTNSDQYINMGSLNVDVNNQTTEYWIDVSPTNGNNPGELCVYGIQVTYSYEGVFLPFVQRGV